MLRFSPQVMSPTALGAVLAKRCRLELALTLSLSILSSSSSSHAAQDPYTIDRDQVESIDFNLNHPAIRPMLLTSAIGGETRLYAVNTHDSTVEYFLPGQSEPAEVIGVPWGPVSIASWFRPGDERLLVVCRGSNSLVQIDANTGDIVDVLNLRKAGRAMDPFFVLAEPSDLVRLGDTAFISCTATDSIVEVDLLTNGLRVWNESTNATFRHKSPLFLAYDDFRQRVMVAPLTSGNRSIQGQVTNSAGESFAGVMDIESWGETLPDEDLFAIDPSAAPGSEVTVEMTSMGTILFAHGLHPVTKEYWQLNTEALNKDPERQSEPQVKGDFIANRVTRLPWAYNAQNEPEWQMPIHHSLDEIDLGNEFLLSIGQPNALAFHSNGNVIITGLLTDNVIVLDSSGNYVDHWDLPEGTIPRAVLLDENGSSTTVFVYGWGSNEILRYDYDAAGASLETTHKLNHDPTPRIVKQGREIFYDGHRSEKQNASCASCHVDGRSDLVVWNLSNKPIEDKGPMMTQTLFGIERLAPFHWRGERPGLVDFNGAFVGLLGASEALDETEGGEFDQFEAFVFSLQSPANPFVHRDRMLEPANKPIGVGGTTNPKQGQRVFSDPDQQTMGSNSCMECHGAPLGTKNDIFQVFNDPVRPERAFLKVTPFHELYRKDCTTVAVRENLNPPSPRMETSFLGPGFSHDGELPNLFKFINAFGLPLSVKMHITAFVRQFDQGTAPAAHYAFLLDSESEASGEALTELTYLEGQAARAKLNKKPAVWRRNCGIAVFGQVFDGNTLIDARWFWDAQTLSYRSEDPLASPRTKNDFLLGAANHGEVNVFVGLPTGVAERFAIDYDMDGLPNLASTEADPYVVSGSNLQAAGFHEVPTTTFVTAKVARLAWETDQPTTALVEYWDDSDPSNPGEVMTARSRSLSKVHSVILTRLRPSTFDDALSGEFMAEQVTYKWRVTASNVSDVQSMIEGTFGTENFIEDRGVLSGINRDLWEHHTIVEHVELTATTLEVGHRISVETRALLKRGVDPTNVPPIPAVPAPAVSRATAFTVFKRSPGEPWTQVDDFETVVTPTNVPVKVDELTLSEIVATNPNPPTLTMASDGPYVIAPLTGADGSTDFSIVIPGLTTDDEVLVQAKAATKIRNTEPLTQYQAQFDPLSPADFVLFVEVGLLDNFQEFSFADSGEPRAIGTIRIP